MLQIIRGKAPGLNDPPQPVPWPASAGALSGKRKHCSAQCGHGLALTRHGPYQDGAGNSRGYWTSWNAAWHRTGTLTFGAWEPPHLLEHLLPAPNTPRHRSWPAGSHRHLQASMGTHRCPQTFTGTHRHPWLTQGSMDSPQGSMSIHGHPQASTGIHGLPEASTGTHGHPQAVMGSHAELCGQVPAPGEHLGVSPRDAAIQRWSARHLVPPALVWLGHSLAINNRLPPAKPWFLLPGGAALCRLHPLRSGLLLWEEGVRWDPAEQLWGETTSGLDLACTKALPAACLAQTLGSTSALPGGCFWSHPCPHPCSHRA